MVQIKHSLKLQINRAVTTQKMIISNHPKMHRFVLCNSWGPS